MGKVHACKVDIFKHSHPLLLDTVLHKVLSCLQVSIKGKACVVSLLQLATYSGRCMLVRLLPFRDAQLPLPNGLLQVLSDSHVLKVGVGCYEDGKRLASDHGLALVCTVDLRYLALRQR